MLAFSVLAGTKRERERGGADWEKCTGCCLCGGLDRPSGKCKPPELLVWLPWVANWVTMSGHCSKPQMWISWVASWEATQLCHAVYPRQGASQEAGCACPSLGTNGGTRDGAARVAPFTTIAFPDRCNTCSFMSPPPRVGWLQGACMPPTPQIAVYLFPVHAVPSIFLSSHAFPR
jgi:hypothetical protein